jgi:hypothetical protein
MSLSLLPKDAEFYAESKSVEKVKKVKQKKVTDQKLS